MRHFVKTVNLIIRLLNGLDGGRYLLPLQADACEDPLSDGSEWWRN